MTDRVRSASMVESLESRTLFAVVTAMKADAFVDSIGVNVRFQNAGSPYQDRFSDVKAAIDELDVRHLRNVAPEGAPDFTANNSWATYINRLNELGAIGAKSALTFNKRLSGGGADASQIDDMLGRIVAHMKPSVEAVMGLNEYDINAPSSERTDGTWDDVWRSYQQELFDQVNANSQSWVRNLQVIAGPTAFPTALPLLGNVSGRVDVGATHYYTENKPEGNSRLNDTLANDSGAFGSKPVYFTEGGYNNAVLDSAGMSWTASGKYTPRYLLANFEAGIKRSYIFEFWSRINNGLGDRESQFGLIDYNGTKKPAYYGIRNMIDLLQDATWNGTKWSSPSFTPGTLNYSLSGTTSGVEQMLFQKSNGKMYLVLWKNNSVWNATAAPANPPTGDVSNSVNSVTVNFGQSVSQVRRFSDLDLSSGASADQTVNSPGSSFSVSVGDEIVILEITRGSGTTSAKTAGFSSMPITAGPSTTSVSTKTSPIRLSQQLLSDGDGKVLSSLPDLL